MKQILKYYVRLFVALFPIFFLPIVVDPYGFGKNWILLVSAMAGMVLYIVDLLIGKREEIKVNRLLSLLMLVLVWAWIGWWRMAVGVRMRSLVEVGGIGTLTGLVTWFFLWLQVTNKDESRVQLNWLTITGLVTAIVSIIVFVIPTSKLPINFPKNNPVISITSLWSLTGSLMSEVMLIVFLVLEWIKRLVAKLKNQNGSDYIVAAVITAVLVLVLGLDIYRIVKADYGNLDGLSAWVIAVEVFKRSPLWGIGIGNFWQAFSSFRPASYNMTSVWASGFKYSSSGILQLWTELGIIGVGLLALMGAELVRQKKNYDLLRLVILGLAALFLPIYLLGLVLLMWLLANTVFEPKDMALKFKLGENGFNVAPYLMGVVVVGLSVFGGYWMYRVLVGDIYMRQSLLAASKNEGGNTYNLQIKAIGMNPTLAEYRRMYSQTNLALASTILSNKDVKDEDKEKASVLIQQSVREAKAAIALDNLNPTYWSNLAGIYRQLIGVVDGSADWSFQAYQQAAALDPSNPLLKLDLGGLLYAANRFDEADRVFEQVVAVKQDFANGWYNWAYTAKGTGRLADAVQRLTQAVALVPVDSGDYEKASKELVDWKKELDEAIKKQQIQQQQQQPKQPETLKTPEPLPTAGKEERVNVPAEDLEPPVVSPTITPQVTPQLTPSPTKPAVSP